MSRPRVWVVFGVRDRRDDRAGVELVGVFTDDHLAKSAEKKYQDRNAPNAKTQAVPVGLDSVVMPGAR